MKLRLNLPLNLRSGAHLPGFALSCLVLPLLLASPVRAQSAAPVARLAQNDARLLKLEATIAQRINAEREKRDLRPLTYDSQLADTARAHSAEMRDKKYFAHQSPTPQLRHPLDRYVLVYGDTPRLIAENIFRSWSSGPQKLSERRADEAHKSLMNSPGHRANILLPEATRLGIGLVANANGDLWVTQMFSRP